MSASFQVRYCGVTIVYHSKCISYIFQLCYHDMYFIMLVFLLSFLISCNSFNLSAFVSTTGRCSSILSRSLIITSLYLISSFFVDISFSLTRGAERSFNDKAIFLALANFVFLLL